MGIEYQLRFNATDTAVVVDLLRRIPLALEQLETLVQKKASDAMV